MSAAKILGDKNLMAAVHVKAKGQTASAEKENHATSSGTKRSLFGSRPPSFSKDDSSFTIYEEQGDIRELTAPKSENAVLSDEQKIQIHTDFVTSEEPSLQYWKLLAETRRNALAETLEENEKLCNQLEEKDQEIAKWKSQCRSLETKLALVEADKAEMEEILEGYKQMSEMIEGLGEQQEAEVDGGSAEEGRAVDDNGDE